VWWYVSQTRKHCDGMLVRNTKLVINTVMAYFILVINTVIISNKHSDGILVIHI